MEFFIIIILGLAIVHFIYDGIIAPSLRLWLRLRLFKLRDRLRELKASDQDGFHDVFFQCVQDSLNGSIRLLSIFDFGVIIRSEMELRRDKSLARRLAERERIIADCPVAEVAEIRQEATKVMRHALCVNSGSFLLYVLPIAYLFFRFSRFWRRIRRFLLISEQEANEMFPPSKPLPT